MPYHLAPRGKDQWGVMDANGNWRAHHPQEKDVALAQLRILEHLYKAEQEREKAKRKKHKKRKSKESC